MIQLTLAGAAPRIPLRYHRRKDGTIFPIEIAASTFPLKGRAIRQVLQGPVYVSKNVSAALLEVFARHGARVGEATPALLSDREFEVFQLIGQGLSTQQIGRRLNLSAKTVGTHRQHIKEKLKVRTAAEVVQQAVRWAAAQQLV